MEKAKCCWKPPNSVSKCTFELNSSSESSPHSKKAIVPPSLRVYDNVLEVIGNTPLIRLSNISRKLGLQCELLAKCEYLNPGGSVKDRIGLRMVEEAEKCGRLKPGDVLIEPTSGNTGIGLAMAAAVKGYRCQIVMPEKMSREKVDVLRALGAEIVRTPTAASFDSPESLFGVSRRMMEETEGAHILDQYTNPGNPLAHYDGTAEEILVACGDKLDMMVLTAGTGGTLTGIARKIKQRCPKCIVVAVDPVGSQLAEPESLNESDTHFYEVEGIGYDFLPTVCERKYVDRWYKTTDRESFGHARKLIREEALLVGGSSGACLSAAVRAIRDFGMGPEHRVVVLLADSVRNYMSKYLTDEWMIARDFLESDFVGEAPRPAWWDLPISSITMKKPSSIAPNKTIDETLRELDRLGYDQMPVVDDQGAVLGIVTTAHLLNMMVVRNRVAKTDPVGKAAHTQFRRLKSTDPLGKLSRVLQLDPFVLVVDDASAQLSDQGIRGILTSIDLMKFVAMSGSS